MKRTCGIVEHFIDHHREEQKESYEEDKKIMCFKSLETVNLPTSQQMEDCHPKDFRNLRGTCR